MHKIFLLYLLSVFIFLNPYSLIFFSSGSQYLGNKFSLILFYPFFFFPIFIENSVNRRIDISQLLAGCGLAVFSYIYFSFAFFWIGSLLICLSFLPYFSYRFQSLGIFIFLLTPPFVEKYTLLIGFELRIFLSYLTGLILGFLDSTTTVQGNLILFKNQTFSVDPACEGLKFFTGLFLLKLSFFNTFLRENINLRKTLIILLISVFSFLIWLWANLVRIIILILFSIPEESFLHSIVGVISFLCFIGLPFTLLWIYYIKETNQINLPNINLNFAQIHYNQIILFGLPILLSFSILIRSKNIIIPTSQWEAHYGDFTLDTDNENKESQFYRNKKATMILKRNLPILGVGHHPKICFEAIGYSFKNEEEIFISKSEIIRRAEIEKDKKKFFLSWWYTKENKNLNTQNRTTAELEWRKDVLFNNQSYVQVNLITNSKKDAYEIYKELAKQSL